MCVTAGLAPTSADTFRLLYLPRFVSDRRQPSTESIDFGSPSLTLLQTNCLSRLIDFGQNPICHLWSSRYPDHPLFPIPCLTSCLARRGTRLPPFLSPQPSGARLLAAPGSPAASAPVFSAHFPGPCFSLLRRFPLAPSILWHFFTTRGPFSFSRPIFLSPAAPSAPRSLRQPT